MTLLFIKRLNDTFEENAEKLIEECKSEKEVYGNKNRNSFLFKMQDDLQYVTKSLQGRIQSAFSNISCYFIHRTICYLLRSYYVCICDYWNKYYY